MKLANIYTVSGGAQKGQSAAGTSDTDCVDVKASDSGGVQRDIIQVVRTDTAAAPTVMTRRLVATADCKYALSPFTASMSNAFNNYSTSSSVYGVSFDATILAENFSAARTLFKVYVSSSYYHQLLLTTAGALQYKSTYNGSTSTQTFSAAVTAGVWTRVRVYGLNNSTAAYCRTDDNAAVSVSIGNRFYNNSARTVTIGDEGIYFRGALLLAGTNASLGTTSFSSTVEDGTVGETLSLSNGGYTFSGAAGNIVEQAYSYSWQE